MMSIRKVRALILSLITAFTLSGCALTKALADDPKHIEKDNAAQIFEYLKNEDIDSLSSLFSPEAQKKHDLKSEWKTFFDHIDGKIVSYKSIKYPNEGLGKDKSGEVYDSHISVNYNEVKTDSGKIYQEFGYYRVQVSKKAPESEGLSVFTMKEPDTGEWIIVGDNG